MVNRIIRIRRNEHQKKLVQEAIKATLSKKGVVVSRATTVKEICAAANYNRSVEVPLCGTGKLKVY
jgi:hypothetical protein